jgi:hypothetical protein
MLHGIFALVRAVLAVLVVGAVLVAVVVVIGAVSRSPSRDTQVQAPPARSAVQYPDAASEPLVASDNAANIQELPLGAPELPVAEIEVPAEAATETAPEPVLVPSIASPSLALPELGTQAEADIAPQPEPEPAFQGLTESVRAGPEVRAAAPAPVYQAPRADGVARREWAKPGPGRFPRQTQTSVPQATKRRFFGRLLRGFESLSAGTGVVVLSGPCFSCRQWDYGRSRPPEFSPLFGQKGGEPHEYFREERQRPSRSAGN